jgi:hypothetical protein
MSSIKVLIIGTNGRLEKKLLLACFFKLYCLPFSETTSSVTLSKSRFGRRFLVVFIALSYMVRYQSALTTYRNKVFR